MKIHSDTSTSMPVCHMRSIPSRTPEQKFLIFSLHATCNTQLILHHLTILTASDFEVVRYVSDYTPLAQRYRVGFARHL
jgi:hypothetical protein